MTPRTRLLAASLGLAVCAGARAEVVVYGVAMPFLENVRTSNASDPPLDRPALIPFASYSGFNDPSRARISVGTSMLGFRGSEDLRPGLKVVWQLESGFQIDQNTGPGLGARNSKVGLLGAWGEVLVGQWDTPYKFISLPINPFRAGYVFDYTPIMGNPGLGVPATTTQFTRVGGKPDAAFDKRAGNSVQYWSPRVAGFAARLGWSTDEGRTSDAPASAGIKPQIWSAALMYDVGSLSLRYAYEQHDDYFGLSALGAVPGSSSPATNTNRRSKDRANKLVALYRIGATRIAATVEELRYRNDEQLGAAIREYQRRAYYVLVEQYFGGTGSVWGSYGRAEDGSCDRVGGAACSTRAMGAGYWSVGYIYRFSKRTEAFATYYRIDNKESGTYSAQPVVGGSIAPGADTTGAGVGIIHYF